MPAPTPSKQESLRPHFLLPTKVSQEQEVNQEHLNGNDRRHWLVAPRIDIFDEGTDTESALSKKRIEQEHQAEFRHDKKPTVSATAAAASPSSPSTLPQLLLLQLPSTDWTAQDLKRAKFVIFQKSTTTKPGGDQSEAAAPVSLVVESLRKNKCASFAVHKVETSNAWVLVPPRDNDDDDNTKNMKHNTASTERPSKRPRGLAQNQESDLTTFTRVRLLQCGSGASFLELRPNPAPSLRSLYQQLLACTLTSAGGNPARCTTVPQIANRLACTQRQVYQGLARLQQATGLVAVLPSRSGTASTASTFTTQHDDTNTDDKEACYGLWNDDLRPQLDRAFLATLAEECPTYASSMPTMAELVPWIKQRLPTSVVEKITAAAHGDRNLNHWIQQVIAPLYHHSRMPRNRGDDDDNDNEPELVLGSLAGSASAGGGLAHVARLVAQSLFMRRDRRRRQTVLWEERELLEQWKIELPGDQPRHNPLLCLQGLAVRVVPAITRTSAVITASSLLLSRNSLPDDPENKDPNHNSNDEDGDDNEVVSRKPRNNGDEDQSTSHDHDASRNTCHSSTTQWMYFPLGQQIPSLIFDDHPPQQNGNDKNKINTSRDCPTLVDRTVHAYFFQSLCSSSSSRYNSTCYHSNYYIQEHDLMFHLRFLSEWFGGVGSTAGSTSPEDLKTRFFVPQPRQLRRDEEEDAVSDENEIYYAFNAQLQQPTSTF
ncbi:hypothetical protein ACA910_010329 [Epithemia clementina (nom. ined.)]